MLLLSLMPFFTGWTWWAAGWRTTTTWTWWGTTRAGAWRWTISLFLLFNYWLLPWSSWFLLFSRRFLLFVFIATTTTGARSLAFLIGISIFLLFVLIRVRPTGRTTPSTPTNFLLITFIRSLTLLRCTLFCRRFSTWIWTTGWIRWRVGRWTAFTFIHNLILIIRFSDLWCCFCY